MPIAHPEQKLAMARHRQAMTLHLNDSARQNWQRLAQAWGAAINDYVRIGNDYGWDVAGEQPESPGMQPLYPALLEALRAANAAGDAAIRQLREDWPPSPDLYAGLLEGNARAISQLAMLADGSILARIGASYETPRCVRLRQGQCEQLDSALLGFGLSGDGQLLALASVEGIAIHAGWQGERLAMLAWPTGAEGLPYGLALTENPRNFEIEALQPFPDGQRVLLACRSGVYVLAAGGATRLHPDAGRLHELARDSGSKRSGMPLEIDLDMVHAALSPDGRWIAAGDQCSVHVLFDAALKPVGHIGPHSEYPHYAVFAADSRQVLLNACHFYSGCSIGVNREHWIGLDTDYYDDAHPAITTLQEGARVYAAVSRAGEYIVGDAHGYLRAFGHDGTPHWTHFVGSTISSMALSGDGKTLAVGSYGGAISLIALDSGERDAWQIGTGPHRERERWLFWQQEATPLRW